MTRAEPSAPDSDPVVRVSDLHGWIARLGVFIVSLVLFRLGFELWWVGRIHENLWVQVLVSLYYLGGLAFLVLAMLKLRHERLDFIGFFVLLQALAFYTIITTTVVNLHYTSDALLFVHQSAEELLAGRNPYVANLVAGYESFNVPYYVQTPTTTGGIVSNLNYPALSFLLYVPFVAFGLTDLRPASLAFLIGLLALLFLALPRHLRLVSISLLFLSSFFLAFTVSGFDILFVYFLLSALIFWDGRPRTAFMLFGLAAAVKQTVWFIAPFLLIALWKDHAHLGRRQQVREFARATWGGAVAFLVPNLPFLIWDPMAWLRGVLTPFGLGGESLVPLSQGVTVFMYTGALAVDPFLLHLLAGSVLLSFLAAYWIRYDRLRELAWIVPAVVLAFSERSLQNYFEMFYPIALYVLVRAYPSFVSAHARPTPTGSSAGSSEGSDRGSHDDPPMEAPS